MKIFSNLANVFRKLKPIEINIIIPESVQKPKLTRIEKLMKLYNQCIEDRQWHKVQQAYRCVELAKELSLRNTRVNLEKIYLDRYTKQLHLNKIR
jgi:flagellar motor switch protein FliM